MNPKILLSGQYWDININQDFGIPGYLFVRHTQGQNDKFSEVKPQEYAELGKILGLASTAAEQVLGVSRVISGKFGIMPNHPLHYHILPLYDWFLEAFAQNKAYHALQKLNPNGYPAIPDGAELVAFAWREYCFTGHCPVEVNQQDIFAMLSEFIHTNKSEFGLKS